MSIDLLFRIGVCILAAFGLYCGRPDYPNRLRGRREAGAIPNACIHRSSIVVPLVECPLADPPGDATVAAANRGYVKISVPVVSKKCRKLPSQFPASAQRFNVEEPDRR